MNVPMEQWDLPKWYFPMMKTLRPISDIGVLVVEWLLPSILTWYNMKIKSTKQFWWRFNHLKRNGGEITVTDRTSEMDVKDFNRIESLVRKRVRWELGSEGMAVWDACGYKDIPTLAKAYRIS